MKKIFLLLLFVSNYAYASFPDDLFGLKLGMDKKSAEMIMNKNNLKECKTTGISADKSCYSGENIQALGIIFDEIIILYDENNMTKGIVFKLFIPQSDGTQKRIFRHLYDEIKPYAKSTKDENIRYNYLFKIKQDNSYVRVSINEVLQGDVGYKIILSKSYTDQRFNEY